MPTLGAALDFAKLEGKNLRAHQLGAAPSSPVTGQLYYNTGDNTLYWYNGTTWIPATGDSPPDATPSVKGILQLAGDLAGTAAKPSIATLAQGARLLWDSIDSAVALPALSVTTPSLSSAYKHLLVTWRARSTYGGSGDTLMLRFNGAAAAYYSQAIRGHGAVASAAEQINATSGAIGDMAAAGGAANTSCTGMCFIPDYARGGGVAIGYQPYVSFNGGAFNSTTGTMYASVIFGFYAAGIAVSSLTFLTNNAGSFPANSRFSVYGLS